MARPTRLLPPCAAALMLSACAAQDGFPSLAPRAVERELAGDPPPLCLPPGAVAPARAMAAPPAAAPVPDPQTIAQAEALLERVRQGERDFAARLEAARASVRRAGAPGSESWIAAQQEISRLEAARAPSVDALAELDALVLARSGEAVAGAALLAANEEARRIVEAQQAELDRLTGALSGS